MLDIIVCILIYLLIFMISYLHVTIVLFHIPFTMFICMGWPLRYGA